MYSYQSLVEISTNVEYIQHAGFGIKAKDAGADFGSVVKRSRGVADGMSKGIDFLMKKNKIEVIMGTAKSKAGKKVDVVDADGKTTGSASNIIVHKGARSRELPNLPQDGKKIIGYRKAMTLDKKPSKMVVVGSGAIGVEFAYFYNAMGVDVLVVEYMPNIVPVEDEDISNN